MAIRIKSRSNESVEQMMRRFKKLCEKEGLTKEIKRKEYYEKPSERRRRAMRKARNRLAMSLRRGGPGGNTRGGSGGSGPGRGGSQGGGSRR